MRTETGPSAYVLAAGTNALGVVRGLREARVPTVVVATRPGEPSHHSRFPVRKLLATARTGADGEQVLLETLMREASDRAVLFPTSDAQVSFLARNRETLAERFDFLLPGRDATETLIDKSRETRLMESLDVPLPETLREIPSDAGGLLRRLRLPIIVKPRSFEHLVALGRKNVLLRTEDDVVGFLSDHASVLPRLIAQEVVPGGDDQLWVCHATFGKEGNLVQAFTFRRLRLSPAHYGVTSFAVSQRNPEIIELGERIGRRLQYPGPVMFEFKWDSRDDLYKYIETNPRFGLCNWFDARCGINNVLCAYRIAAGLPHTPSTTQTEGVLYISLFEDLPSRLADGEPLGSIAWDYLRSRLRSRVGAYFDWRDPGPALMALWNEGVLRAFHKIVR